MQLRTDLLLKPHMLIRKLFLFLVLLEIFWQFTASLDPLVWTQQHVQQWVDWVIAEYNVTNVNPTIFSMLDGIALCSLSKEDFCRLVNPKQADVFITHLDYLRSK